MAPYFATPAARPVSGIWIGLGELAELPAFGPEFDEVLADAMASADDPIRVSDQDDRGSSRLLASAMVGIRVQSADMIERARARCLQAIDTDSGARTLGVAREFPCVVEAARLVGVDEERFDDWVDDVRFGTYPGRAGHTSLLASAAGDANNWGTHALFASLVAARFRRDAKTFARCARYFAGAVGDRDAWDDWTWETPMSWHADVSLPRCVNPKGATIDGKDVDGVQPDDQRRGGGFTWPPPTSGDGISYSWERLQGLAASAVVLERAGFDAFEWSERAVLRVAEWHERHGSPAAGDDAWIPHLLRQRFPEARITADPTSSRHGKHVGWTRWTTKSARWGARPMPR